MFEVELCDRNGANSAPVYAARNIGVNRMLKGPRTARFQVGAGHPLRARLRTGPRPLVKVYDVTATGRTLKHIGPLTSYHRRDGDDLNVDVGSTDAAWYLTKRFVSIQNAASAAFERGLLMKWTPLVLHGEVPADASFTAPAVDPLWDAATGLYEDIPSFPPLTIWQPPMIQFDTGIRPRTIASTPTVVLPSDTRMRASDLFSLCAAGLDGPDWLLYPSEPTVDTWGARIAHLDVAPVIGTVRANAIFNFAHGKNNVSSYEEILDAGAMANLVFGRSSGFDLYASDSPAFLVNGALQDFVQIDIPNTALSNQLLADHIAVRKDIRQIITFTIPTDVDPSGAFPMEKRIPIPGVDYDVGDTVTFAAVEKVPIRSHDGAQLTVEDELIIPPTQMRTRVIDEADDDNGQRTTTVTVTA